MKFQGKILAQSVINCHRGTHGGTDTDNHSVSLLLESQISINPVLIIFKISSS